MFNLYKKLWAHLPFRLCLCIIFTFLFGDLLSENIIRISFTASSLMKEVLMAILPIMIFGYIFAAILSLDKNAPWLIAIILIFVTISNAMAAFTSYFVGTAALPFINTNAGVKLNLVEKIKPYLVLDIPQIISPDKAMLIAMGLGFLFCYFRVKVIDKGAIKLQNIITLFLEKCFIPCLPLYILGFLLKMDREGNLGVLFKNYAQVFVIICVLLIAYILIMYLFAANFSLKKFQSSLKQMSAAGITGFSTISSALAMPVTIKATENNISDNRFARLIIPATVNIHMIGHGLSIPITSLVILLICGCPIPSLDVFAIFVLYFCLAKFSASAVPGGGIIVILPILQSKLGFTAEMSSIIIMLDILQDAVLTTANVMGNGAFAMVCYEACKKLKLV